MAFDYRREYNRYKQYYLRGLRTLSSQPITKATLGLILSLATISFFTLFALKPTIITITNLWEEKKIKKDFEQKLGKKIQSLQEAQIYFAEAQAIIPLVDKTLPVEANFTQFERELEYLVFKNNLVLVDAQFDKFDLVGKTVEEQSDQDKPKEKEKLTPINFKIRVGGSYLGLKEFLSELERLDRTVTIEQISFAKETDIQGADLEADLKGKVYFLQAD